MDSSGSFLMMKKTLTLKTLHMYERQQRIKYSILSTQKKIEISAKIVSLVLHSF